MKRLTLIAAGFLLAFTLNAQETNSSVVPKQVTRRSLMKENEDLRNSLDSLQRHLDQLRSQRVVVDEDLLVEDEPMPTPVSYSQEVTDSLLHLWYKNTFSGDFDPMTEYDMDSEHFTSNVSDEEMMQRLKAINAFITLPFNETVKNYIILYSEKMPSKMGRTLGLANYYFPIFEETLRKYDLPLELKYMAIIESSLNPVAKSRAGAMGIWQFMYNTGKSYGLEINSFVDERLDVEKAADAAARYLRDAYKTFGDWPLAISSYNCGAGNVSKAIRRAGGNRDFWSIYDYLPKETRGYMPAFVGALYAMTYYREYGIVPQNVGMPAQTDTFHIKKNLHFEQIHKVVGVPREDIANLNPQYIHEIIPGDSHNHVLKLPYTWTGAFLDADKDSLYAYKADSLFNPSINKQVSAAKASSASGRITYRVKSGDYLGKIASKYHVSVNQLKSWNKLRSNNLQVGQVLYIYTATPAASTSAAAKPAETPAKPAVQPRDTSSTPAAQSDSTRIDTPSETKAEQATVVEESRPTTYVVKKGDTLFAISRKFEGITPDDIKKANSLVGDALSVGQVLTIPNK